jgi:hypothetical protein
MMSSSISVISKLVSNKYGYVMPADAMQKNGLRAALCQTKI